MVNNRKNKEKFSFVYLIPLINIFADIFTNYFESGIFNPGSIRGIILFLFIIYFLSRTRSIDKTSKYIIIFLIYLFILTLFSTDFYFSFMIFTKAAIAFMMYPIGYYYINNIENFRKLNIIYISVIAIIVFNLLITNYFSIGTSDYLEGTFYFGSARVNITKTLAALLLCSPTMFFIIRKKINKRLLIFLLIISLIIVFIGVKRAAIIAILAGSVIYFMLTPRKGKTIKYLTYTAIILFIFSPIYLPILEMRLQARENRFQLDDEALEHEARYNEIFMVLSAMHNESILHKLFGSELFNDRAYFKTTRMLHTDYMTLLNGSGFIGIMFFLLIYLIMIMERKKYYNKIKFNPFIREINAVFWTIIFGMLILSVAGTIHVIGLRAFLLMYLGAIIRLMKEEYFLTYYIQRKNRIQKLS